MDTQLDISSLWYWTLPLWGLFIIVMFLGGILLSPVVLQGLPGASAVATAVATVASVATGPTGGPSGGTTGGARRPTKHVRFA